MTTRPRTAIERAISRADPRPIARGRLGGERGRRRAAMGSLRRRGAKALGVERHEHGLDALEIAARAEQPMTIPRCTTSAARFHVTARGAARARGVAIGADASATSSAIGRQPDVVDGN